MKLFIAHGTENMTYVLDCHAGEEEIFVFATRAKNILINRQKVIDAVTDKLINSSTPKRTR